MLHITAVKHIRDKVIWVSFDDGVSGNVDLDGVLTGPVFEPLHNQAEFSKAYVDPELETIAWPNGADLAPEFVKELLMKQIPSLAQG